MPEIKMKLTGWKIIPVLLILAVIVGVRIAASIKGEVDPSLLNALENEIHTAKMAVIVAEVKGLDKTGGGDKIESMLSTAAAQRPVIKSVRTTKSILDFSTEKRDVVVEVNYSLGAAERTEYYRFLYRPLTKSWSCMGKSSKALFYMHLF